MDGGGVSLHFVKKAKIYKYVEILLFMAKIKEIIRGKKKYYYLSHSYREGKSVKKKETYLGETLPKNLEELVEPPNGLKHRLLKEASEHEITEGMKKSIETMQKTGTKQFYDFREGGLMGICQLKSALELWKTSAIILSRPEKLCYDKNEVDLLLKNSDGIGLSSISEWDYSELEKIAKKKGRKTKK